MAVIVVFDSFHIIQRRKKRNARSTWPCGFLIRRATKDHYQTRCVSWLMMTPCFTRSFSILLRSCLTWQRSVIDPTSKRRRHCGGSSLILAYMLPLPSYSLRRGFPTRPLVIHSVWHPTQSFFLLLKHPKAQLLRLEVNSFKCQTQWRVGLRLPMV